MSHLADEAARVHSYIASSEKPINEEMGAVPEDR